jgi:hypothetical protein
MLSLNPMRYIILWHWHPAKPHEDAPLPFTIFGLSLHLQWRTGLPVEASVANTSHYLTPADQDLFLTALHARGFSAREWSTRLGL